MMLVRKETAVTRISLRQAFCVVRLDKDEVTHPIMMDFPFCHAVLFWISCFQRCTNHVTSSQGGLKTVIEEDNLCQR